MMTTSSITNCLHSAQIFPWHFCCRVLILCNEACCHGGTSPQHRERRLRYIAYWQKNQEGKNTKKLLKILLGTQKTANFVSFQNPSCFFVFCRLFDFRENRKQQKMLIFVSVKI
ncbi:unnamed protein product [Meloidogyne enterolobii]|uniref:Uncharacterized protein n=1 Tax=Meloidogyne enterolobii TaxID=390850 RepID=A0ACB0YBY8_MELEN